VESGGPEAAEGCAGRGNALALDLLKQHKIKEKLGLDFVIYDVIGDVVCGGFAQPMRAGYAQEVYLVCSGELMAMYSANNICIAISDLKKRGAQVGVAGIICNMRNIEKERDVVEEFSALISVPVIAYIPRDRIVQDAESNGCTVVEYAPNHPQSKLYQALAEDIIVNRSPEKVFHPTPIELEDIMDLMRKYNIEG
jgi:nitrogenase iron protein NifH